MKLDFEKLGFVLKPGVGINPTATYTKPYPNNPRGYKNRFVDVVCNPYSEWVLICQGDAETPYSDWETMFAGYVHDQGFFEKLLTATMFTL